MGWNTQEFGHCICSTTGGTIGCTTTTRCLSPSMSFWAVYSLKGRLVAVKLGTTRKGMAEQQEHCPCLVNLGIFASMWKAVQSSAQHGEPLHLLPRMSCKSSSSDWDKEGFFFPLVLYFFSNLTYLLCPCRSTVSLIPNERLNNSFIA